MVDDSYVSNLVVYGKSSPLRLQALQARVDVLFTAISLGNGQDMVGVTMPGNHISFSRSGNTIQDEFGAVTQALALINGQPNLIRNVTPVFW
jgi:hypothetical protein